MAKTPFIHTRTLLAIGAVALLLFNGWLLSFNFEKVTQHEGWVRHTHEVILELELVMAAAKDTETGVRGYILSGQRQYLDPYINGELAIREHMRNFTNLTKDNPAQTAARETLEQLLNERITILRGLKETSEAGLLTKAKLTQGLDEGKVIMDRLRAQVAKMEATEHELLRARATEAQNAREVFLWSVILTTLFSILVVGSAFQQFRRNQLRTELDMRLKREEAWAAETLAQLAAAFAGDTSLEASGEQLGQVLSERFGFLVMRSYTVYGKKFELVSQIGDGSYQPADGEDSLLQTAISKDGVWEVVDLPESHFKIRSALGDSSPRSIVFIPIRFQNQIVGVIEAGRLEPLTEELKDVLERAAEVVGVGLNAVTSRERLKDLLERTQQQSEELEAQQEELRTNNEELEQQARALESQQQSLNIQNQQLEEIRRELEFKAEDLGRASQYKSDFLAKMSHELRTPLNGLLILATLLTENKEGNLNERQQQFAKSIQSAGQDLLILINDILDLSKIEARKLALRPDDFTLAEMLEHKRITFGPQAQAKNLKLEVDLDEKTKALKVFTDRQRLEQIIRNFVSNALKFTDKGGVTISARLQGNDRVRISVRDTGIGIPKDKQSRVFDAFEQIESSDRRNFGGTGLGLTIARELAELLGGQISLTSEVGVGSVFTVEIPVRIPEATVAAANSDDPRADRPMARREAGASAPLSSSPSSSPSSATLASHDERGQAFMNQARQLIGDIPVGSRTILIVEDDNGFRRSVAETARGFGFHPIEAEDGELAFKILEQYAPDAILLDIKLPGISGLGLLEMIKQIPQLRHVPVHMISALDYQQNALKRGALGYLTKPVTIEKVRAALSRIENFISEKVRKVLVIEDDQRQSEAISALIAGDDVSVDVVRYGREAVERIKEGTFDCIILDLTLPDLSGFDLLSELSGLPISLPPIVIYTGKELSAQEENYLRKFSDSIIIKGARSPERLLDEVNLFLHRVESLLPNDKREMLSSLRKQGAAFDGKTVLVVDDDMRNVFALTNALESKGLNVVIAKDGVEALEKLDEHAEVDLVLMDIMMPRMDGYEAMAKIRDSGDKRVRAVPVIALTAKAMREDHERCIQAGANDYLPKPVNLDNLFTAMKVWLEPKGYE